MTPSLILRTALVALLTASTLHGQEEPAPPTQPPPAATAPVADGAQPPPPPSASELLPELFAESPDPFSGRTVLQARRLRGLTAEVAATVLRGEEGGGLGVAALAVPLPGAAVRTPAPAEGAAAAAPGPQRVPVPLFVEIDGASFLESNQAEVVGSSVVGSSVVGSSVVRVEVYAYALTAAGGVAGHLTEAFAVDAGAIGEAVWEAGLRFYGRLDLPPGDYTLRVLVRNAQSGAGGLTATAVTVPPPGGPPTPVFATPEDRDAWVAVRSWGDGPEAERPAYPFVAGRRAVSPTTLPVLVAGRPAEAYLFGASGAAPGRLVFTPAAGGAGAEAEATAAGGADGPRTLSFTTPALPSGEYLLRVAGRAGAPPAPAVPVLVMAGEAAERSLLWTDLRWRVGSQLAGAGGGAAALLEPPAETETGGQRRRSAGRGAQRTAAAYRAALAPLAAGDEGWEPARAALFALQSEALAADGRGSLSQLQQGLLAFAQELAARAPEALPPLIRLHDGLYQDYRRRRVFSLASFNRLMVESLAELYAANGGAGDLAAAALVSLGGYLQEANLPASSSRLLRRALALDPGSRAARLALASLHERLGDPRGAVDQLGPALAAAPGDAEAKLRLAINLGRGGGDRRQSATLLEEVAAGDGPAWVRAVAHQELARRDLTAGDAAAAARRLEAAVQELPDDRGLHLLLALAYDRLRQPREALDTLTRVGSGGGESPRKRYDDWPEEAIGIARSRLESGAAERRPELVRALDGGRG